MTLFIESFTVVFVVVFSSVSSADIHPKCHWISEVTKASMIIDNSTMQELNSESRKFSFPLLRSLDLYRNFFPAPVEAEPRLLERAIFEYIRGENVNNVIMLHKTDSDDGLLLSELLYSNSVRVIHIEVQVVCEALKIMEHYFSTLGSSNSDGILLISLEDGKEIDGLLMSLISSKRVQTLVVGGLQKWQDRLLEVKVYEIHLIVITNCKGYEKPVGSSPIKEEGSIYGTKSEDVYTVWKSFLADEGSQKLRQVAVWTNASRLIKMAPEADTITFRLALVDYRPFISLRVDNGTVSLEDCILKRLLKEFTERLNLKFKLIQGHKWGSKVHTEWTGATGMVMRGEADMIPYLPVTEFRQNVLDFTKPKAFVWHGILVAYPKESSRVFIFFRIYQKEVWILLITSTTALSYILCKILNFSTESQKHTSFFQCFWSIYGFLFQQGATRLPSVHSARIILVTFWLSTLVITATFSGNLVAFFASSQDEYIVKSLDELADHETISLAIKEDSPVFENIQMSQISLYQRIRQVYLRDGHRLKIVSNSNMLAGILNDVAAGNTIYIDESHHLVELLRNNMCRVIIAPDRFVAKELAFGMRKGSSLLEPMNEQIQKMTERGIFAATEKEFALGVEACTLGPPGQRAVKVGDLLGPFCILLLASLFGCLILGVEVIGDKLRRKVRSQDTR